MEVLVCAVNMQGEKALVGGAFSVIVKFQSSRRFVQNIVLCLSLCVGRVRVSRVTRPISGDCRNNVPNDGG